MPELPEVETVMRGMRAALEGQTISRVELRRADLRWPIPPELPGVLTGATILSLKRRGKYILIRVSGDQSVLLHLGMTGRVRLEPLDNRAALPHEHVIIETDSGIRLGLIDPRRFGALGLVPTIEEENHPLLAEIGAEPLDKNFNAKRLTEILAGRKTSVKTALLDQRLIAGLGNIYVCEALFRAEIHPERPVGSLSPKAIAALAKIIPEVLNEAIAAGGSSLRDYVDAEGNKGGFQELHQVYGREGEPCPVCPGPPVCFGIRRITQSARSSFYCPRRQLPVSLDETGA
ncbi:bifunctional DNA-formamidopyrimidine glycosylase/DNA-(apurinic or apyrimidinic site) lyase [Kozakia baliensis]|uniref:bifunctional DNA-formamidopyrimidine glycosylase/DNA-(apurinic or apyrimidinic site) lyase n=1 Tax=Kozakia baliensis TaxID=153496 RepID=UPI00345BEB32